MPVIDLNNARPQQRKKRDFKSLNAHAAHRGLEILQYWLPGGRQVRGEYVCADLSGGKGSSCSTNIATGKGSDFAASEAWGDYIALVAAVERVTGSQAYDILEEWLGIDEHTAPAPPIIQETDEEKHEAARVEARNTYEAATPATATHPYLMRKGIPARSDVRVDATGALLIPIYGPDGDMRTLQKILPDGHKLGVTGGRNKGSFHLIDGDRRRVFIAEGYATALSVHLATGACAVHAMSATNLPTVAGEIANLFPASDIIIAADNDAPGAKAAAEAIKKVPRARTIHPPKENDWNDHMLAHGVDSTRQLLLAHPDQLLVDLTTVSVTEPDFLIVDAIETPCTGTIIGASGAGKSFFALDIAFHVASGRKWLGKAVKEGAVIYICGEGRHAIPRRLKAWESRHGAVPAGRFFMAQRTVSFEEDQVQRLVAEIDALAEQIGPVLIVVDTMARALPGDADENSAQDVGLFIRQVDAIRDRYACAVLIVHHTGWSEGAQKRGRGSSALKGALDIELLLHDGLLEWSKTKDMEPHLPVKYSLAKVAYGDNPRDNSCVIEYDLDYDPSEKKMTAAQKCGMDSLTKECERIGATGINADTWRDAFYAMNNGTPQNNRQQFNRAKKELVALRQVEEIDGVFSPVKRSRIDHIVENDMFWNLIGPSKS